MYDAMTPPHDAPLGSDMHRPHEASKGRPERSTKRDRSLSREEGRRVQEVREGGASYLDATNFSCEPC